MLSGYTAMVGLLAQHQAGIPADLHHRRYLIDDESVLSQEQTLIRFIVAGFTHGLATDEDTARNGSTREASAGGDDWE